MAFVGGTGTDTLNVYGDASTTSGQLSAISITGMGMGTNQQVSVHNDGFGAGYDIHDSSFPAAIYYATRKTEGSVETVSSTVETVNVYLGSGDDKFNIDSTYAYGTTYVHGGAGEDTLTVASTPAKRRRRTSRRHSNRLSTAMKECTRSIGSVRCRSGVAADH